MQENCIYILLDEAGKEVSRFPDQAAFGKYLAGAEGKPVLDAVIPRETANVPRETSTEPVENQQPLIFRHGETEANRTATKGKPTDELNATGKKQAEDLGESLKGKGITTILSSDYTRARQTAELAAKNAGEGIKTEIDKGLREKQDRETDLEFVKRVKKEKEKLDNLPPETAVIGHGLFMKAVNALDQTGGDVKEASKIYKKLPNYDNTNQIKKGGNYATTESKGPLEEGGQQGGIGQHPGAGTPRQEKAKPPADNSDLGAGGESKKEVATEQVYSPLGEDVKFRWGKHESEGRVISADAPGRVSVDDKDIGGLFHVTLDNLIQGSEKLRGWLEDKKVNTADKALDATLGIPLNIWNAGLKEMQKSLEQGEDMLKAFKKLRDYVDDNYDGNWNKEAVAAWAKSLWTKSGLQPPHKEIDDIVHGNDSAETQSSLESGSDGYDPERLRRVLAKNKELRKSAGKTEKKPSGLRKVVDGMESLVTAIKTKTARQAAIIINKYRGQVNMDYMKYYDRINDMKNGFLPLSHDERIDFLDRLQHNVAQKTPKLETYATDLKQIFKDAADMMMPIAEFNRIEHYFPQMWKNDDQFYKLMDRLHQDRPKTIQGSDNFLKQRMIESIVEGLEHGLELVSDNPGEIASMYLRNAYRYKMGADLLDALIHHGLARPVYFKGGELLDAYNNQPIPKEFEKGDYSLFNQFAKRYFSDKQKKITEAEGKTGQDVSGIYVSPEVNKVLNAIYAKGLTGDIKKAARVFGNMNNAINFAQLGISLFHGTTTTALYMGSHISLALQHLSAFDFGGAAKEIGKTVAFPVMVSKAIKQFEDLKLQAAKGVPDNQVLNYVADAGGKLMADPIYTNKMAYNMRKAFYENVVNGESAGEKVWGGVKTVSNAVMGAMGATTNYIMHEYVPAIKMAVFADLARSELKLLKPKTELETLEVLQRAWTNVDNRHGEMVYDRIFMNKTAKEIGFLGFRAFGWTVGNFRQYFGSVTTGLAKSGQRLVKGEGINPDLAFTISALGVNAMMCSTYNYLRWGRSGGNNMWGLYSGEKNKDGTDKYVLWFSHVREIWAYTHDIAGFAKQGKPGRATRQAAENFFHVMANKISPSISFINDLTHNEDYFGNKIMDHNNFLSDDQQQSITERIMNSNTGDLMRFLVTQMTPISFKSPAGEMENPLTYPYWHDQFTGIGLANKLGIVQAPLYFDRQTWQNLVMDHYIAEQKAKHTTYDPKYTNLSTEIQTAIANEGSPGYSRVALDSLIAEGQKQGLIGKNHGYDYFKQKNENYFASHFAEMSFESQMDVLSNAKVPDTEITKFMRAKNYEHFGQANGKALEKWALQHLEQIRATYSWRVALDRALGKGWDRGMLKEDKGQ